MSLNARVLGALLTPVVTVPVAAQAAHAYELPPPPTNPNLPRALDIASPYLPQTVCDPVAKPGVTAFARLMSRHYEEFNYGISRNCNAGLTEHSEGRALDWMLNKNNPDERAVADAVVRWLVAPDASGQPGAMARRFGVMYIIWDRRIWGTYSMNEGWRPYYGSSPHTDHIHFSFSWDGAMQRTSWWTGKAWTSVTSTPGGTASTVPVTPDATGLSAYFSTTVRLGSTGSAVRALQQELKISADGVFGPQTESAVKAYQKSKTLQVDGVVTSNVWRALAGLSYTKTGTTTTTTSNLFTQHGTTTLKVGSRGTAVTALQKALKVTADGAFGPQTESAVKAYQRSKSIRDNGVVDGNTWRALSGLTYTKTGTTTTSNLFTQHGTTTLKVGSRGTAVTALQKALKVTADGAFGPQTESAVKAYQRSKSIRDNGVVDGNTWRALSGLTYNKTATTTTSSNLFTQHGTTTLKVGSRGTAVTALQKALKVTADGAFGPQTESAVKAYQKSKTLKVDGVVTSNVWRALAGLSYTKTGTTTASGTTTTTTTTALSRYKSTVLALGARGEAVKALQRALGGLAVDGVFGSQTERSVKAFQTRSSLRATGIVDGKTWDALEAKANPFLAYRSTVLRVGSRGAAVTVLQRALAIPADGVYGSQTEGAVRAFQKRSSLTQTGIVTTVTWDALARQIQARAA